MIKELTNTLSQKKMKAIIFSPVFIAILFFSTFINAQKDWPKSRCTDSLPHKQLMVICWRNNVLHVIEKHEPKKETCLNKMINQTSSEVKKMQKSIASVDHTQNNDAGIFQYRKEAEGLKEKGKSVMIH